MNYSFKIETDFHNGYVIKRRDRSSLDNPWVSVAQVDSEKALTFSNNITAKDEKKEIENFAIIANII